jgi:hypothetical protein
VTKVPRKVSLFVWNVALGKNWTIDNLRKWASDDSFNHCDRGLGNLLITYYPIVPWQHINGYLSLHCLGWSGLDDAQICD